MNPPGNPTENPELDRLNEEVAYLEEKIAASIKRQKDSNFKERVEQIRLNKILKATLNSIEAITKGPDE